MKRIFPALKLSSLIFTLLFFIGSMSAQNNMDGTTIRNRVNQIFEYSNTQNWAAMRESLADTMKMYSLTGEVVMNNPDDLITYFKSNYAKFPNEHSTIENLIILGNKAIVKEKITGHENNKPIYDVLIFEFAENKIASARVFFE